MISDAIMRGMDLDSRDREDSLDDALKDLDPLTTHHVFCFPHERVEVLESVV
jgi:hypothetical protein